MTFEEFRSISKPTVNFLSHVFSDEPSSIATIQVMEAEQDVDGLCNALEMVVAFCQKEKQKLKEANRNDEN